jgi:2-polyprenyl-6-methoxyphenol hydroxylase-like FAD-dependent oxidoreductase
VTASDVVVAGAGAGGLAAAHALGLLGLRVLVLDRSRAPAPVAKGEILQPESARILDGWGTLPALMATGARAVGRLAIRDPDGQPLLTLDYDRLAGHYRQIICADYPSLQAVLATAMPPGVRIERGARAVGLLRDDAGRVAGVKVAADGALREQRARLVVAADGMSSQLRKAAGITARRSDYPHRLLAFDVAGGEIADEVTAYRTGRGLCLSYPMPAGRCRLYAQVAPDEFRGRTTRDLTGWCDQLFAQVPALRELREPVLASMASRQLLAVFRLRAQQLTVPGLALVGEAAHAVHPMAAQGINSSLGDAEVLAAAIADAGTDTADLDRALGVYAATRQPRLDHIATVSHNAARMITSISGAPKLLGGRMMRNTAANPRLLAKTAGNLSGTSVRPLSPLDRMYQLGILPDPRAGRLPAAGDRQAEAATVADPR